MSLKEMNVATVIAAIEKDAGKKITGLATALRQAKAGTYATIYTPEDIKGRKPGRPAGTKKPDSKVSTNIRLSPVILEHFKASGPGWQSKVNDALLGFVEKERKRKAA